MAFTRILCPVDFDDNSLKALDTASNLARQNHSTVFLLHVVPMIVELGPMPMEPMRIEQEATARAKLLDIAQQHLSDLKYEILVMTGEPANSILNTEKKIDADIVVIATHGRRGFKRFFLGSIAEAVLRESSCPVITVREVTVRNDLVAAWMTRNPVTATPHEKLTSVAAKMNAGGFRSVLIVDGDAAVGIVTDRDIRSHHESLDQVEAFKAMSDGLVTVTPSTSVREAARLIRERKVGGLPVVENGKLAGVITSYDVLEALSHHAR